MPYDPILADRIRAQLAGVAALTERKMFGGIGWMIGGNMAAGAHSDGSLMIRCSREDHADLVTESGAAAMVQGGRHMTGWILVDADVVATDAGLARWVQRGRTYAASLPKK